MTTHRPTDGQTGLGERLRAAGDWIARRRRLGPIDAPAGEWSAALPDLQILLTAQEAFPVFERRVLAARHSLTGGFRIFDPATRLLSEEAQSVGETWEDLIADALRRGVQVRLFLSDFDPISAHDLHRSSWSSHRRLTARAAAEGLSDRLDVQVCMHPAQSGLPIRLAAAPAARAGLRRLAAWLNDQGDVRREEWLRDAPGLDGMLVRRPDGRVAVARRVIPPLRPVTHHQKVAVVDSEWLYIGGLDLDNRRADGPDHPRAGHRTWADVQVALTGPIAASAEEHLLNFNAEVAGTQPPVLRRPGLLRTLSRRRTGIGALSLGPKPVVSELHRRTVAGVARANRLIYLETQFLRDLHFARDLARRGQACPDLGLIIVLPAAPEDLAFAGARGIDMQFGEHLQARCVEILSRAFGDRAAFVSAAQPQGTAPDGTRAVLHGAPIIYVHTKVSVFDDRLALVSSANLNGRSHRWDTEAGIAMADPDQVRHLRDRLMRHWLPDNPDPTLLAPEHAPAAWRAHAAANAAAQPREREGFLLPYPAAAPRRFGRPIPGVTQDIM